MFLFDYFIHNEVTKIPFASVVLYRHIISSLVAAVLQWHNSARSMIERRERQVRTSRICASTQQS